MKNNTINLYQTENCLCPADCVRHGKCKACIAFHHNRREETYCEAIKSKLTNEKPTETDVGKPRSGKEIRLLDYAKCAG